MTNLKYLEQETNKQKKDNRREKNPNRISKKEKYTNKVKIKQICLTVGWTQRKN